MKTTDAVSRAALEPVEIHFGNPFVGTGYKCDIVKDSSSRRQNILVHNNKIRTCTVAFVRGRRGSVLYGEYAYVPTLNIKSAFFRDFRAIFFLTRISKKVCETDREGQGLWYNITYTVPVFTG